MTPDGPIEPQEAAALFSGLDRPVAVAVSGGVDSVVLMHLIAAWWRTYRPGLAPPIVLTVDHGLRAAAREEAAFVAAQAASLGLPHETLVWSGPKPSTGVQSAARDARYDLLLGRLARASEPRDLLLAHHLDDQAETFLMRLARGSGIDGLSAMRSSETRFVTRPGHPMRDAMIRLRRPLLELPKARLLATAKAGAMSWRHDPSNDNLEFERVRIRAQAPMLEACGLGSESIGRSVKRLDAERTAALARADRLARVCLTHHGGAYGELDLDRGHDVAGSDLVRLLARLLGAYGGASPPARLSQIEKLAASLQVPQRTEMERLTLGGCLLECSASAGRTTSIKVFREAGRLVQAPCRLEPGCGIFWDQRFYVSLTPAARRAVDIMPFGAAAGALEGVPAAAAACLPAVATPDGPRALFGDRGGAIDCNWPHRHLYNLGLAELTA